MRYPIVTLLLLTCLPVSVIYASQPVTDFTGKVVSLPSSSSSTIDTSSFGHGHGASSSTTAPSTHIYPFLHLQSSGLHDPVGSVQGLITRLLGSQYVDSFVLEVIPADPATGMDVFELAAGSNNTVIIRGNAGYSIAAGLNWYLKYTLNISIAWGRRNPLDNTLSGNNLLPLPLPFQFPPPIPSPSLRTVSPVRLRYAYNVCTFGYTMTFWNFTQFEEEIDRIALWGVNTPLAFQGQEYIWYLFYQSIGMNTSTINDYFTGPAFLPWGRMGNIQNWGGPLNDNWYTAQNTLQLAILNRLRSFGMVPVLPGFAGHVPGSITTVYPNANITTSANWAGFTSPYSPTYLLEPTDPLFLTLGTKFYQLLLSNYGDPIRQETPIFNTDTFNEMSPNSGDLTYLKECNAAIYASMTAADPQALYMIQAWTFGFDGGFWTLDRVQAFLSGVPIGKLIVLDLHTSDGPMWNTLNSYFGHYWVWNALLNGGGRLGLFGETASIAAGPYRDHQNSSNMVGIGFTPEGIGMVWSQFDLMMEAGWRNATVDPVDWFTNYALRRYGGTYSSLATQATLTLLDAAYNAGPDAGDSVASYPAVSDGATHAVDADGVVEALRLLTAAAVAGEVDGQLGPYQFDLTDVHRQVLVDLFADAHAMLAARFATGTASNNVTTSTIALVNLCRSIMQDLDTVLGANINFLLGTWIADAAQWGTNDPDPSHLQLYLFNARNQLTLWGPPTAVLDDYAAKDWAGLVGDYYLPRWMILFNAMITAAASTNGSLALNLTRVNNDIGTFMTTWIANTSDYPSYLPNGNDPVVLATGTLTKYATFNADEWIMLPDTDIALPNRTNVSFIPMGNGSVAVSPDCPYTNQIGTNNLTVCQEGCLAYNRCNFINFYATNSACIFRLCVNPLHAVLSPNYPGWVSYAVNTTSSPIITATWHTVPGIVSNLCDTDPTVCVGFNSDGLLVTNVSTLTVSSGTNLYVRKNKKIG